jgi:DNA-nicking Smr family endonuclease
MVRMKQNEEEPKGESDYEQSFQRLYAGFKAVKPHPVLAHYQEEHHEEEELVSQKSVAAPPPRTVSSLSHRKRLEYENCLSWARKHQKNGEFFAKELGKFNKNEHRAPPIASRSLIDEIGKKIEVTWLE